MAAPVSNDLDAHTQNVDQLSVSTDNLHNMQYAKKGDNMDRLIRVYEMKVCASATHARNILNVGGMQTKVSNFGDLLLTN
jgi:hypothetical protein